MIIPLFSSECVRQEWLAVKRYEESQPLSSSGHRMYDHYTACGLFHLQKEYECAKALTLVVFNESVPKRTIEQIRADYAA